MAAADLDSDQAFVRVEGAGTDAVNGIYLKAKGEVEGTANYAHTAQWEYDTVEFSLYRLGGHWYISIVPAGSLPGTGADTDFYVATVSANESDHPPEHGWRVCNYEVGIDPPPTVKLFKQVTLAGIDTVSVARPVAASYKEMLLSEKFSDVSFVCPDGETIPSHRNILAASSPYFDAAFGGQWTEAQSGELKTSHPARIVKAMLTLLYTGDIDPNLIQKEPLEFLSISCEYNLDWLKAIAEQYCVRALDPCNLKEQWQAACLYESDVLKTACIEYTKKNSLAVLANGSILHLQTEDEASWEEFQRGLLALLHQTDGE